MSTKLLAHTLQRMKNIEIEMFRSPPKTMEDFQSRWARHNELEALAQLIEQDAKGIEDDAP